MAEPRRAELKDETDISGSHIVIIEARFYDDIQDALLAGATSELDAAGVGYDVISVPGALEIPAAIAIALDASKKNGRLYDGAIALGCVIRGDTIHFEIVSMESSPGADGSVGCTEPSAWQRRDHGQYHRAGMGACAG